MSGTGYNSEGEAEAGMGVDASDYDGDGLVDLVVTNYDLETNALYRMREDGNSATKGGLQAWLSRPPISRFRDRVFRFRQ